MFKRRWNDFDFWRRAVAVNLTVALAAIVAYWVAWQADRSLVATSDSAEYVAFEQAFPLADAWLVAVGFASLVQLLRQAPSAMVWLLVAGGAAIYLCALDVLYNLQHGTYETGGAAFVEIAINAYALGMGAGAIYFAWRFRRELLDGSESRRREEARSA